MTVLSICRTNQPLLIAIGARFFPRRCSDGTSSNSISFASSGCHSRVHGGLSPEPYTRRQVSLPTQHGNTVTCVDAKSTNPLTYLQGSELNLVLLVHVLVTLTRVVPGLFFSHYPSLATKQQKQSHTCIQNTLNNTEIPRTSRTNIRPLCHAKPLHRTSQPFAQS
jgi:hypothetical protein